MEAVIMKMKSMMKCIFAYFTQKHSFYPFFVILLENYILVEKLISSDVAYSSANFSLYCTLIAVLIILPFNWYVISVISALFLYGINYLNQFLLTVRGRPLNFIDFYCISEALRVSKNYDLIFSWEMLSLLIQTIGIVVVSCAGIYALTPPPHTHTGIVMKNVMKC